MAIWHSDMGRVLAVSSILSDVVGTNDAFAAEGRCKDRRIPRHRKLCKRFTRYAGDGVEHVALARRIDHIVEKRAEFGAAQVDACLRHRLHQSVEVGLSRENAAGAVEDFEGARLFAQRRFYQAFLRAIAQYFDDADRIRSMKQRLGFADPPKSVAFLA